MQSTESPQHAPSTKAECHCTKILEKKMKPRNVVVTANKEKKKNMSGSFPVFPLCGTIANVACTAMFCILLHCFVVWAALIDTVFVFFVCFFFMKVLCHALFCFFCVVLYCTLLVCIAVCCIVLYCIVV